MHILRDNTRWLIFIVFSLTTTVGSAKIFYSKNEALALAFGAGTPVEILSLFPTPAQINTIQSIAKITLDSGLFSFYVGKVDGKITGYAAIESSTVRTKPETLMIVLTPEGTLRNVYTLAFHEPPEYMPPERWYSLLSNRTLEAMDFSKGIQGIAGATLSTRSALSSVRKVMAFYEVLVKPTLKP